MDSQKAIQISEEIDRSRQNSLFDKEELEENNLT